MNLNCDYQIIKILNRNKTFKGMITQGVMYITEQKYLLNGSEINAEKGYVAKNHNFICEKTKTKNKTTKKQNKKKNNNKKKKQQKNMMKKKPFFGGFVTPRAD